MLKTAEMWRLESEHPGVPIKEIVAQALEKGGSLRGAAKILGVKHTTVHKWARALGIRVEESRRVAIVAEGQRNGSRS
jgi:transposase-like protein